MAGKTIGKQKVADPAVRADDGVLIEGVEGIVPDPRVDQLDPLELGHAAGQHRPDLVLPQPVIGCKVVVGHRRIVALFGWAAGEVVAPVGAHVHPAGVDGQRQVLIQRLGGIKDKRVALARLHGQLCTDHARGFHCPGTAGVDHLPAGDGLARGQPHSINR